MRVTIEEITRCLRKDLGAKAGAAYARRVAATGGMYAAEYQRAAERLEREIGAFERHRARDPHCTCNDCITAHFEPPPARCRSCGAQAGEPTTTDPWTCPDCLDAGY